MGRFGKTCCCGCFGVDLKAPKPPYSPGYWVWQNPKTSPNGKTNSFATALILSSGSRIGEARYWTPGFFLLVGSVFRLKISTIASKRRWPPVRFRAWKYHGKRLVKVAC